MNKSSFFRILLYGSGLLILAFGITLNTKTELGVSPIISVAYSISSIWVFNFGNVTFALYGFFILIEMVLHILYYYRAKTKKLFPISLPILLIKDILQLPLSLIFTRFLNLFSILIPDLTGNSPTQILLRFLLLIFAIVLTGVGAAMSLTMRLVPNPGDGVVQAIADCTRKSVGFCKNFFDLFCILVTIVVSVLFSGHLVGIGMGTILAVIGVGRSIAAFNYLFRDKLLSLAGVLASS